MIKKILLTIGFFAILAFFLRKYVKVWALIIIAIILGVFLGGLL